MIKRRAIITAICLISALTQMPAAHAQVAQILQLATGVVRVLPRLLKSNSQGHGGNNSQRNNQNNNQQANNDSQSNTSHVAASDNAGDVMQSMHGHLIASRAPASTAQPSSQPASPAAVKQAPPAPFVMMSAPE